MKELLQTRLYSTRIIAIIMVLLWFTLGILMDAVADEEGEQLIYIEKNISKKVIVDFVVDGDTIDV
ncbi:hypothetical protein H8E77_37165, partial [bacterium]|nr:hypothetical protein [bacterium]